MPIEVSKYEMKIIIQYSKVFWSRLKRVQLIYSGFFQWYGTSLELKVFLTMQVLLVLLLKVIVSTQQRLPFHRKRVSDLSRGEITPKIILYFNLL